MCGRYLFSEDRNPDLKTILDMVLQQNPAVKVGEVFPANLAPVVICCDNKVLPTAMIWGFPQFQGSGVIINARAETAEAKKIFRNSLLERRCVIPASGFYEWKKIESSSKEKYQFALPDEDTLYMAGFYNIFDHENRFCILTTAANTSVANVHNRMPVIMAKNEISAWLKNTEAALKLLKRTPPLLKGSLASA